MRIGMLSLAMALLAGISTASGQAPPATTSDPAKSAPTDSPTGPASSPYQTTPGAANDNLTPLPLEGTTVDPEGVVTSANNQFYSKVEYLLWKMKDAPLPPLELVLPSLPAGVPSGVNDLTNTVTLPNVGVEYAGRSGGRFTFGYWLRPEQDLGLEATFFLFERRQDAFISNQIVNIPATVTVTQNIETVTITAGVAQTTVVQTPLDIQLPGQLTVSTSGRAGPVNFWGGELNARGTRVTFGGATFDLFAGFRYMNLDERLSLDETINLNTANPGSNIAVDGAVNSIASVLAADNTLVGTTITTDTGDTEFIPQLVLNTSSISTITTRNHFYGAQVGSSFEWFLGPRLSFNGYGKLGVGAMVETFTITSFTTTSSSTTGTTSSPGSILTPLTGSINQGHTRYAIIPEFNINLGYQLTPRLRSTIGYNFLYLSTVVRPGDQFAFTSSNTNINLAGTTSNFTPAQPSYNYHDTDFWAQGLTAGLEFRW